MPISPQRLTRVGVLWLLALLVSVRLAPATVAEPQSAPLISGVTTNLATYPQGQVPRYEKFELTFAVATRAENPQLPYDPLPPPGIRPGLGITVNALFSPDNWQTVYTQPAFLYQDFEYDVRNSQDWIYPTDHLVWKVRFAPTEVGTWRYKLTAQDADGSFTTDPQPFVVAPSANKGFIRVSARDARYFEYDDGTPFLGLGYNMNFNHISWDNPVTGNRDEFQTMQQDGVQLVRLWLSQWSIYGSAWNPWNAINPDLHGQYIPTTGLSSEEAYPGSDVAMKIDATWNPCMVLGFMKKAPAVKSGATYRVRIRYKTANLGGPRVAGQPYGFVAKIGGWLWGPGPRCDEPAAGQVVTTYQSTDTPEWRILEGRIHVNGDFLPNFYLVTENMTQGDAYVDTVCIEEDLGEGRYGPNIVSKPWMAQHLYMAQRESYAFDRVVEMAEAYDIYLRPVILEKNEYLLNHIDYDGRMIPDDTRCGDNEPANDPPRCPGNQWFYGAWRQTTKVRWLQQAWWRYLQARWGYSTHIHSWELLNEGDPFNEQHYTLADEFGKTMRQFAPNAHLVSTSMWHSFPAAQFWANPAYPNVDFADVHAYLVENQDATYGDAALASQSLSMQVGAYRPGGAGKPVIRGEMGFQNAAGNPTPDLDRDTQGVWLHDMVWAGVNSGGLIESYWYETYHIYQRLPNGELRFDHRPTYRAFANFMADIPLSNGHYRDSQATTSQPALVAWGQTDPVHGMAHLWLRNRLHTWKNVVDGASIPAVSGTVVIGGFEPSGQYAVQWWDTYQPDRSRQVIRTDTVVAQGDGAIVLPIQNLTTDIAVKIIAIPQACTSLVGDVTCDCRVDNADLTLIAAHWGATAGAPGYEMRLDLDHNGSIDIRDIGAVATQFGASCR